MEIEEIRKKYQGDAVSGIILARNSPNIPEGAKKMLRREELARNNKEFQAAKRKWLDEMDKFLDGKIRVQPKMPRLEDFMKK